MIIELNNSKTNLYKYKIKKPIAVMQIVHGSKEHVNRYDEFIKFLNKNNVDVWLIDIRGHGKYAQETNMIGDMGPGDLKSLIPEDINTVSKMIKEEYPNTPYIQFGHSMGSFIARTCAFRYKAADKYIFSGTANNPKPLSLFSLFLINLTILIKGKKKNNKLIDTMSYKAFDKPFKKKGGSWISSINSELPDKDDKLCGFPFTNRTFKAMLIWSYIITKKKNIKNHPNVPTLFIAGEDDPVGNFCKGPKTALKKYSKTNNQIELKTYPKARHEILRDVSKDKVMNDILEFIKK